jgi:hypothetical protein
MSVGNLKDSGNQGNNFPWQLKVLQGLQEIAIQTAQPLTCAEDSVSICADGDTLTSTTIGTDTGLDVNIIGGVTLEVNLDALDDQVGIYGYTDVNDPTSVKAIKVDTNGVLAIQDNGGSITVDGTVSIAAAQFTKTVTPNLILSSAATGSIATTVYSISFASNGTTAALVSVDGGVNYISLPIGTTINLDAGGLNWSYAANKFAWDTTAVGASLIITYNS